MKRSEKVTLDISLHVGERLAIADLLGLQDGEEVPDPSEWKDLLDVAEIVSGIATSDFEIRVTYANPAHDPDTVPMFPELAPDPFITLEVA